MRAASGTALRSALAGVFGSVFATLAAGVTASTTSNPLITANGLRSPSLAHSYATSVSLSTALSFTAPLESLPPQSLENFAGMVFSPSFSVALRITPTRLRQSHITRSRVHRSPSSTSHPRSPPRVTDDIRARSRALSIRRLFQTTVHRLHRARRVRAPVRVVRALQIQNLREKTYKKYLASLSALARRPPRRIARSNARLARAPEFQNRGAIARHRAQSPRRAHLHPHVRRLGRTVANFLHRTGGERRAHVDRRRRRVPSRARARAPWRGVPHPIDTEGQNSPFV